MSPPRSQTHINRLRIIGGQWRSRTLTFPDVTGLRPTGDRVRETLFNWLGQTLHDQVCLDAFAGSGALGFEAASRGAARVLMCERDRTAYAKLVENRVLLGASACEVVHGDVLAKLAMGTEKFDLVFCDPPFAARLHNDFLVAIVPHLAPDACVYVESATPLDKLLAVESQYEIARNARAGAVYYGLLTPRTMLTTR